MMPDRLTVPPDDPAVPDLADPEWLVCMEETCGLLWPPPAVVTIEAGNGQLRREERGDAAGSEFALIPGIHQPPALVPADRHIMAAAVRYHSGGRSSAVRLAARTLAIGLAGGLGRAVARRRVWVNTPSGADTIERYLGSVMSRDVRVSVQLGRPRANRKPVLQMFNGTGTPIGFAKVGVNPLTRDLVTAEQASLKQLSRSGLANMTIPRVLHYGSWRGLDVLVMSALPAWHIRRPLGSGRLIAAMTELTRVNGVRRERLHGGGYLGRLRCRLSAADESPERDAVLRALGELEARAGDTVLTLGSWHGDWAPWNMANTADGLLVWDWERFTNGVPVGFDALHYQLQVGVARNEPRLAAGRCLSGAPQLLAPFGVPPEQARVAGILYLADLATRYITDRQAQAGAWLGATGTWLVPVITGEVTRL